MSPQQTAIAALMNRMTLDDLLEALEFPVPGQCFPLGGRCGKPVPDGGWLCDEHQVGGDTR